MDQEEKIIITKEDVYQMLDRHFERRDSAWWDNFYADREKPIPFFVDAPDESLVDYCERGVLRGGRALDIGCGNGRNTRYLAAQGFDAVGLDISGSSIRWAEELSAGQMANLKFLCQPFERYCVEPETFDLILDSGCFHHIKPHRREEYLTHIARCLKADGTFLMTCLDLEGGAAISDYDAYRDASMHGGMGFSEGKLRRILSRWFQILELRKMRESDCQEMFGKSFLWVVQMQKLQSL